MAGKKGSYETLIKISGKVDQSFKGAIDQAERELKGLYQQSKRQNSMMTGIDGLSSLSDQTFRLVEKSAQTAAVGLMGIATASTIVGASYEKQMSSVQAISNASAADMERLNDLAKEMGRNTQFSATEAGQGLEYMAMAGWNVDQMVAGLPSVLNLAAASGEELGLVSDIVTDALTAFGLQAEDTAVFADVLAEASNKSNTDVAMMGETFQYVAPVAGALKFSIQDTAVAIGLMANAGIKGSQAGTALRSMMSRLTKPTKEVRGAMNTLGLSITNSDGSMRSLREIMQDMRSGFAGLETAQQASVASALAGQEAMSGLLAIVNASPDDFNDLAYAIDHSTGAAERMAEVRIDNLAGDLTLLQSAAEGAGIGIYEAIDDILREGVQQTASMVNEFTESDFLEDLSEEMPTIRRNAKEFGKFIGKAIEPVLNMGEWFLEHPDVVAGGLAGVGSALLTWKAAKGATSVVKMLGSLSGMIGAWPVAAAGLAVGGIVGIGTAIKTAEKAAADANLDDHFGDIVLSIEELDEAARHIVSGGGSLFDQLDQFQDASDSADQLAKSLEDGLAAIRKSDWKLSMGIAFDADDTESYVNTVDQFVKNAQDYITNSGYEVSLAVDIVFGEDGRTFSEDSDAFYHSLYQRLVPLQEGLQSVMQDITANGLTIDKQELVNSYLSDISDVTSMITEAENAAKLQMIESQYAGADLLSGDTFQNLQQSIQEYSDEANTGIDESYQKILTSLNAQRIAGESGMDGGISQAEFDEKKNEVTAAYYEQKAQVIQNGYGVMRDAIMSAYGDEIEPALEAVNQAITEGIPEIMEQSATPEQFSAGFEKLISDVVNASSMAPDAKNAVKMLLENMIPTQEDLLQMKQQMEAAGLSPAETITSALEEMTSLSAVTGEQESIWKLVGNQISNNEDYTLLLETVEQQSGAIPDSVIEGIHSKNVEVETEARELLEIVKGTLEQGVHAEVPVTIQTVTSYRNGTLKKWQESAIGHYAKGGLIAEPTLSWFAEESPEMAIPIDGSARSLSLWEETGRLLGAYRENNYEKTYSVMTQNGNSGGESGSTPAAPTYAPVMNFYGNTSREEVEEAEKMNFERFREWYDRLQYEQARAAF